MQASAQETPTDLRHHLVSQHTTHHLTNYHFEYDGKPLNEYLELSNHKDLPLEANLTIVNDPYNERTARAHFLRIKELVTPPKACSKGLGEDWGIAGGSTFAEDIYASTPPTPAELGNYFSKPLPSLVSLLCPSPDSTSQSLSTVKSLYLSSWNPPPPHRRTAGDLIYITFTSLEGDLYHITGNIRGFHVSRSTNQKFDPTPKTPQKAPFHNLLNLLQFLSPQVKTALRQNESQTEMIAQAPLANALPSFPWLVHVPVISSDSTRTQKSWLEALTDGQFNLRDWNDEIQSTRSLPSNTLRERLIRERLLQKSLTDFAACATYAAILVRRGELLPLDPIPETQDHETPNSEECGGSMWHYNNIFVSLGGEDVLHSFEKEGGGEASRVAVGKDVVGVDRVNAIMESYPPENESDTGLCTLGTVVVDYLGERFVAQSIVPGIFQQSTEKPDEEGASAGAHRIVYGSVDNGEKIFMDKEFDQKFQKIMDKLHIKKHDVWELGKPDKVEKPDEDKIDKDMNGLEPKINGIHPIEERRKRTLRTSIETKGLRGADGRSYVLDLYRLAPLDIMFLEEHCSDEDESYPHRMLFLRNECVDFFWETKLRAWIIQKAEQVKNKSGHDESEKDPKSAEENDDRNEVDLSGFQFALNPDVFSPSQAPVTEEEKKRLEEDEKDVRDCCVFLREKLIPDLMSELSDGSGGWPVDGKTLTGIIHRNGVNVRFLGKIIELCEGVPKLTAVKV
jgi:protein TIF31